MKLFYIILVSICFISPLQSYTVYQNMIEIGELEPSLDFSAEYPDLDTVIFTPYGAESVYQEFINAFRSSESDLGLCNNTNLRSATFALAPGAFFENIHLPQVKKLFLLEPRAKRKFIQNSFPNIKEIFIYDTLNYKYFLDELSTLSHLEEITFDIETDKLFFNENELNYFTQMPKLKHLKIAITPKKARVSDTSILNTLQVMLPKLKIEVLN